MNYLLIAASTVDCSTLGTGDYMLAIFNFIYFVLSLVFLGVSLYVAVKVFLFMNRDTI